MVVGTVEERRDGHDKIEIEHGHVLIITPDYAGVPIPQDHSHLSLHVEWLAIAMILDTVSKWIYIVPTSEFMAVNLGCQGLGSVS